MKPLLDPHDHFAFSERYYLLAKAKHHVGARYNISWRYSLSVDLVAALLYLYGATIIVATGGKLEKTKKKDDPYVAWALLPRIDVCAPRPPILEYKGQARIVKKFLLANGYTHYWPSLTWPTEEGELVRKKLKAILAKQPLTAYQKKWDLVNKKFKKRALSWYRAYKKAFPNTKLKLWQKERDTSFYFSITGVMRKPSRLSVAQKTKLHAPYEADMAQFAAFLVEKFCRSDKLFPKCMFED
jgi:hypothetical protein